MDRLESTVTFPGGKRVVADGGDYRIESDQPELAGGDGSAPAPFDLFLGALANCAGYFLLEFCDKRGIVTDGLELRQVVERDPRTHRVTRIEHEVVLPDGFPAKYGAAALRAAASCSIKKVLENPPLFDVVLAGPPVPDDRA